MVKTIGLLKTLAARQMAIENILIEHGLTTKDEIQSLQKHYAQREDIEKLFAEVKDEFSNIMFWQLFPDSLNSKADNDTGALASDTKPF